MFSQDWFSHDDVPPFEVRDIEPYDWGKEAILDGSVLPQHYLLVACAGEARIKVVMHWDVVASHRLHREYELVIRAGDIHLRRLSVYLDGQSGAELTVRSRNAIARADDTFRLNDQLANAHMYLFAHLVRSKLERWRREAEEHAEREAEFERLRAKSLSLRTIAARMKADSYPSYRKLEAYRQQVVGIASQRTAGTARALAISADDAGVEMEKAKAEAIEAVICFARLYPDVAWPLSLEQAQFMQENGSRLGL